MTDALARNEFWQVVEDCLVDLFNQPRQQAREAWLSLAQHVESTPQRLPSDTFFHAEPYDVACDIADKEPDIIAALRDYNAILISHNW